jgi:pyruvate dehydrogenase E2 component (dihydrolipoamide acetyltransferase)
LGVNDRGAMAKEVFIPKLGQTMEEARIVKWLVEDGAPVDEGQALLDVETDKAVFTVESTSRGYVHQGPFKEGDVVPVLTVVATVGKADEKFDTTEARKDTKEETRKDTKETKDAKEEPTPPAPSEKGDGKVFASPRARKLAEAKGIDLALVTPTGGGGQRIAERDVMAYLTQLPKATPIAQKIARQVGIDLRTVAATGPGGKITKEDVERVVTDHRRGQTASAPSEVLERIPLTGVRAIIADRMATSVHTTARVTLFMETDATELVHMRERLKARVEKEWGFAPGFNDLLAKIVALALRQFPYMNARLTTDAVERLAQINLGMAVDTERGLLVPVIRDADKKSLREFGAEFRALVERARNSKSLPDDLTGGTFTITNLGMYDVLAFTPVINLPEAAILGVGTITPQPVVRDNQVVIRQMMLLSLVFDHRLVDGAPAARFLQAIKNLIEEPYLLVAGS